MSGESFGVGMERRTFLRAAALVALSVPFAGTLASCAPSTEGGGEAAGGGPVKMWGWNDPKGLEAGYFHEVGEMYTNLAEGNSFEYTFLEYGQVFTKYKTALAGGEPPDIIALEDSGVLTDLVDAGALEDLNDLVADLPELHAGTMDYIEFDGVQYMVPISLAALGLNYNQAMFDQYGVAHPDTLDALVDAAAQFRAAGIEGIGAGFMDGQFVASGIFMSCMANLEGIDDLLVSAKNGEDVWGDERWLEGASYLETLGQNNVFSAGSAGSTTRDQIAQWAAGSVAMLWPATTWMWGLIDPVLLDAFPVEIGAFPSKNGGPARAVGGQSTSFGVAPGSSVAAAKTYLKQIYTDEGTEKLIAINTIPARADFELPAELPHPMFAEHVEMMKTAVQRNVLDKGWNEVVLDMVPNVLFRGATAKEFAEAIKSNSGQA